MNPLRAVSTILFKRTLQETGPASTFTRLCTSRHLGDLQVIASITVLIAVVAEAYVYLHPEKTNSHAEFYTGLATVATAVLSWAFQSGSRRLGSIDLFASEISVICRVCLIVDFAQHSVTGLDPTAKEDRARPSTALVSDHIVKEFTSEEHYTPVYDSSLSDLQPLEVDVVDHVTRFYTYRKTMMDYMRRIAAERPGSSRAALLVDMIYMQYLMYESARLAVADLIEFEPNEAESTINIFCSEIVLFSFLMREFQDFRGDRLDLRLAHYNHKIPALNRRVMDASHSNWNKAKATAPEMMRRFDAMRRALDPERNVA